MKKTILVVGGSVGSLGGLFCEKMYDEYDIINVIKSSDQARYQHCKSVIRTDLRDIHEIDMLCEKLLEYNFSGFVNFAGVSVIDWFADIDVIEFLNAQNVNLNSFIFITQAILDSLHENDGFVISVVSSAANIPMTCSLSYNTSKAALQMAIKQMGRELTRTHGVTVLGVNPSIIKDTNMTRDNLSEICKARGWTEDEFNKNVNSCSPSGELIRSEQIVDFMINLVENYDPNISGSVFEFGVF